MDIFGKALKDYYNYLNTNCVTKNLENIITWTNISDEDDLPLSYLFRSFDEMPKIEQTALKLAKGKTLDVGCGAGSHSLWLQNQGISVKGNDVSKGAVVVCRKRGHKHVECISLLDEKEKYDTILLLMNGTGIFQTYDQVEIYLRHIKSILHPNGQILIDSSDISYMYDDEDLEAIIKERYYGELDYFMRYKDEYEFPMTWLYLDFESLEMKCKQVGLKCEMIVAGEHSDYLAKLSQ